MLRAVAAFVMLLALPAVAAAADPAALAKHREAMRKLDFLIGEWRGAGTIQMGPGPRAEFDQAETIQWKHEGTLLLIEGQGRDPQSKRLVHDALAIVTFDDRTGTYKFRSFLSAGRFTEASAIVGDNKLVWLIAGGPRQIRYTIAVDGATWLETGESSADGAAWTPFFDMKLAKVK